MLSRQDNCLVSLLELPHSPLNNLLYLFVEVEEWIVENVDVCLGSQTPCQGDLFENCFWELALIVYDGVEIVVKAKIDVEAELVIDFLYLSVGDCLVEESNVLLDCVLEEKKFFWEERDCS